MITSKKIDKSQVKDKLVRARFNKLIDSAIRSWNLYLLNQNDKTGNERHYIIFLQNLIAGEGYLPESLNDKVNFYLLRSVDSTLAISQRNLFLYTKMGPLVLITCLKPYSLKNMEHIQIKKRGKIMTAQNLRNSYINEFIFITRPNEAMNILKYSQKQKEVIHEDFEKKLKTARNLQVVYASYADYLLQKNKRT